MSKYTFKNFAIVDGIPFDEYTNDKAKWYKKKTKESYPDISKFITYLDNIDEMQKIYQKFCKNTPTSLGRRGCHIQKNQENYSIEVVIKRKCVLSGE